MKGAARAPEVVGVRIRAWRRQAVPMKTLLLDRIRSAAEAAAFRRRSEMYRWLRSRHDELLALLSELEPPWRVIAAEMTADGVKGGMGKGTGRPPTPLAIRRTWQRVCRDLEAEEQFRRSAAAGRPIQPSRLPANFRPEPDEQLSPLHLERSDRLAVRSPPERAGGRVNGSSPPAPEAADDLVADDVVREKLAKLRRTLQHEDRWLGGSRRKE